MKIIVGLGNVGEKYVHTFHNMGFLAIDALSERLGQPYSKNECHSMTYHADIDGEKVILAMPTTLMNLSGKAVSSLLSYYKCSLSDLLVLYDDIDIPKATIRFRQSGSAGTHNGMRDIISRTSSGEFARIRIGIGRAEDGRDLASYVLSVVPRSERAMYAEAIELACDKAIEWVKNSSKN